jgi:hypothetical protein
MDNWYHRHIFTTNKTPRSRFCLISFYAELIGKPKIYSHILEERAVELKSLFDESSQLYKC